MRAALRVMVLGTMTSPSGAPIAALRLAAGLTERGHVAEALFLYDREAIVEGDHPYATLLSSPPRSPSDFLRMARALRTAIARFRPDALVTFLPLASVLGSAAARAAGVPVRIVSHRVPRATYSPAMRRLDTLAGWSGTYTDVVAVSASVARGCAVYPANLRERTHVVHNGLRDWHGSPLSRAEARQRLGLRDDGPLVVAVGRLDPQKNYPVLIDALARTRVPVRLAIAGDGADRAEITAQIARLRLGERVTLLGNIARSDVPHLLRAADAFAQPSLFEGQSNSLLEALHAGLPCLVSDAPEQVETVQVERGGSDDGAVAGRILPVGDAAAWAEALDAVPGLRDDPATAAAIAQRAGVFTYGRMMEAFEAVIAGAVTRARQGG